MLFLVDFGFKEADTRDTQLYDREDVMRASWQSSSIGNMAWMGRQHGKPRKGGPVGQYLQQQPSAPVPVRERLQEGEPCIQAGCRALFI